MSLTKEQVEELFELSKNDKYMFVGSEIRQLCMKIRQLADTVVWAVERNFRTPEMQSDDWRYLMSFDGCNPDEFFTQDWNLAAKFYDMDSAKRVLGSEYPDGWNIRITSHQIMEDRW